MTTFTILRTAMRMVPTVMITRAWRRPPAGPLAPTGRIGLIIPIVHRIGLTIHRIEPPFTFIIRSKPRRSASR